MSRPQFPVNVSQTSSHAPGPIVNGGLIDFQDNYHRGLSDYAHFMAAQQQQALVPAMSPSFQAVPYTPSQIQNAMQASLGQPCLPQSTLLGHPSFINIAGKMYKPVEEPGPEPKRTAEVIVCEQPRPITDDDVDRRVQKKLNEWVSAQRPNKIRTVAKRGSEEERAAARVKSVNAGMPRGTYYSPA